MVPDFRCAARTLRPIRHLGLVRSATWASSDPPPADLVRAVHAPTPEALAEVIRRTVRRLGIAGCASRMAQEFGDHPETAASRMRWIRSSARHPPQ